MPLSLATRRTWNHSISRIKGAVTLKLIYYLTAMLLGGMHAFEPGHGKTVVAAYLVGSKGTKTDAVFLGLVVTFTHTFTVILMAIAAKYVSTRINLTEEALHGYMGIIGGLIILFVGTWMLIQRLKGRDPFHFHLHPHGHHHSHSHKDGEGHIHPHGHEHGHHEHSHEHLAGHHTHHSHHHAPAGKSGAWQLFLLGLSGGVVPCPAAIAILIAAIGAGKIGEGLTYILLFSLGLAIVLISIGLFVVSAGRIAGRFLDSRRLAQKISVASAALIVIIGIVTLYGSLGHIL